MRPFVRAGINDLSSPPSANTSPLRAAGELRLAEAIAFPLSLGPRSLYGDAGERGKSCRRAQACVPRCLRAFGLHVFLPVVTILPYAYRLFRYSSPEYRTRPALLDLIPGNLYTVVGSPLP